MHHADQPARRLQPEGDRHGLLQQRTAGHHGCAVLVCEPRACSGDPVELVDDQPRRIPRNERGRGVEDVLARRPPMRLGVPLA